MSIVHRLEQLAVGHEHADQRPAELVGDRRDHELDGPAEQRCEPALDRLTRATGGGRAMSRAVGSGVAVIGLCMSFSFAGREWIRLPAVLVGTRVRAALDPGSFASIAGVAIPEVVRLAAAVPAAREARLRRDGSLAPAWNSSCA